MGDDKFATILTNIIQAIQGTDGKLLCALIIVAGGICWWFNIGDKKKWAAGAVIGTVLVFSSAWIAKKFLGVDTGI